MNVKKILVFSILFAAISIQALAQEKGERTRRARPDREQMITAMKERLELNEKQVAKIREIFKSSREEMVKLRGENAEANEEQREKFRELRQKQQRDVNAVLTEEQRKELKEWREEQRRRRRRPRQQSDDK